VYDQAVADGARARWAEESTLSNNHCARHAGFQLPAVGSEGAQGTLQRSVCMAGCGEGCTSSQMPPVGAAWGVRMPARGSIEAALRQRCVLHATHTHARTRAAAVLLYRLLSGRMQVGPHPATAADLLQCCYCTSYCVLQACTTRTLIPSRILRLNALALKSDIVLYASTLGGANSLMD
jgi:hypothetical protein